MDMGADLRPAKAAVEVVAPAATLYRQAMSRMGLYWWYSSTMGRYTG